MKLHSPETSPLEIKSPAWSTPPSPAETRPPGPVLSPRAQTQQTLSSITGTHPRLSLLPRAFSTPSLQPGCPEMGRGAEEPQEELQRGPCSCSPGGGQEGALLCSCVNLYPVSRTSPERLIDLLQVTQLVSGTAGTQPPGTICHQVCSLCMFPYLSCPSPGPENTGTTGNFSEWLGFLKYAPFWEGHDDQQRLFMVFAPQARPWQDWERVVMLPLVRARTLEKDWPAVGLPENKPFLPLSRHILKSPPPSGSILARQTGALSLTPNSLVHSLLVKPQPPKSDYTVPSSRKLLGD